ncbi:hypothetical protein LguiB_000102 [Lonicera macranthoides]
MYNLSYKTSLILLPIFLFSLLLITPLVLVNIPSKTQQNHIHLHKKIQLIAHSTCQGTLYPRLCFSTLSKFQDLHIKTLPEIISAAVNHTVGEVRVSATNCTAIRRDLPELDPRDKQALDDCLELLADTLSQLKTARSELKISPSDNSGDLQTLLSGAMTNQHTCLDGFAYSDSNVREYIADNLFDISHHCSNLLVLLKKLENNSSSDSEGAFPEYGRVKNGFPKWVSKKDRRLLQVAGVGNETKYDLVVAKDGSGNFTTIGEAVAAVPNMSKTRFVIYIKAGAYYENVEVYRNKSMLMFVGDGIGKTLVKGNRNVVDGSTTFRSATVAVVGDGFLAKGITFENYAGPSKHQAVALRSGSDLSAFYQCSFVGYQDTLYVHSLRQYYRDCDIYGTVDFVFGNAAVVLQNCNLYARKPNENQTNIFTAQGREDPNQNTGLSILNCKIASASDLIPVQASFRTFLGRPWREYSRTVVIRSYIGDLVDPAGWLEWSGEFGLNTLYYGEYMNRGPGSNTIARVTWVGYRVINDSAEAAQFSAGNLIQGGDWLNTTSFPYFLSLT